MSVSALPPGPTRADLDRLVWAPLNHPLRAWPEPDWFAAVEAVRNNEIGAEGIPVAPADSPRGISVEMKSVVKVKAEDNAADTQLARAA